MDIKTYAQLKTEDILINANQLATLLEQQQLDEIGQDCLEGFNADLASGQERRDLLAKAVDLAMMMPEQKDTPWQGAASVKLPLIARASKTFAEMAYDAIVADGNIVRGRVIGTDEEVKVTTPVTNQPVIVREQGSTQKKADRVAMFMNWQLLEQMSEWEEQFDRLLMVLPVVGCVFKKTYYDGILRRNASAVRMPHEMIVDYFASDIKTATRISDIFKLTQNEIIERVRMGMFLEIEYIGGANSDEAVKTDTDPQEFIEQFTSLDLDGDGYPEPYIVTIHRGGGKVVRIVADYLDDGIKRNAKGEIYCITRESHIVKYGFMPAFDGSFYDMGFGELLLHLNETANTITNQMLDASTLSILGGGFLGKGVRIRGGELRRRPGEWKMIPTTGNDIRENMVPLSHPEPSATMVSLLQMLIQMANDLGTDTTLDANMNQQAAATTFAMVEKSQRAFKSVFKRIHRALKFELKQYYRLNYLYLTDKEYQDVLNNPKAIVAEDFDASDFDVVPTSDPSVASNLLRLARAQYLAQFKGDPLVNQVKLTRELLYAGRIENPDDYLVEPQPAQPSAQEQALLLAAQNESKRLEIDAAKAVVDIEKMKQEVRTEAAVADKERASVDKVKADELKSLAEAKSKMADTTAKELIDANYRARVSRLEATPSN